MQSRTHSDTRQRFANVVRQVNQLLIYLFIYTNPMKIISNSALRAFTADHPQAEAPLQGWRPVIEKNRFANWVEIGS